mmetsp:Transcript_1618/g.2453  ORF Transcript_1618/g.2453 Transcript_1618/m.2453 type:complete len:215 (-) Transcript_1618:261-905(-)
MHFEEGVADVAHDLEADGLHVVGDLVQCHAVHLDGGCPLLLLEVDVAHVHTEAATERVLLVLDNLRIDGQCLVVVVIGLVLDGKVQAHCIRQVDVELVQQVLLLPKSTELALLLACLLGLLQSLPQVALLPSDRALLDQPVDLLFHLAQLLFWGELGLLLQRLGSRLVALVQGVEDLAVGSLAGSGVACPPVRGHRPGCLRLARAEASAACRHG